MFFCSEGTINRQSGKALLIPVVTRINTPELDGKLFTGPNPVRDALLVSYNGIEQLAIELVDMNGKIMTEEIMFRNSYSLSMKSLPQGSLYGPYPKPENRCTGTADDR